MKRAGSKTSTSVSMGGLVVISMRRLSSRFTSRSTISATDPSTLVSPSIAAASVEEPCWATAGAFGTAFAIAFGYALLAQVAFVASTASQTAWAAMILQEIYGPVDPDLKRAIDWLAATQLTASDAADPLKNPDGDPAGSWRETEFTGTGFPKVFYLRYHLYRLYFPLMAMGRWLRAQAGG